MIIILNFQDRTLSIDSVLEVNVRGCMTVRNLGENPESSERKLNFFS